MAARMPMAHSRLRPAIPSSSSMTRRALAAELELARLAVQQEREGRCRAEERIEKREEG